MTEKKELKSTPVISISKAKSHKDSPAVLNGIDSKRQKEFNAMKKIEVTKEELLRIGGHRWLLNI